MITAPVNGHSTGRAPGRRAPSTRRRRNRPGEQIDVDVRGYFTVNISGTLVKKPAKWWNGSVWLQKPVKIWDGTRWNLSG